MNTPYDPYDLHVNTYDDGRQQPIPGFPQFPGWPGGGQQIPGFPGGPFGPGGPQNGGQPGGIPGGPTQPGGPGSIPRPPQQLLTTYQQMSQNPAQAQSFVQQQQQQGALYAVGCEGRWTIIVTRTYNVFLMYVVRANAYGRTQGYIYPSYTFASFPTSAIAAYYC
ncbi:hypothetical protein [Marinicrinis sediminis]|uniref:Collagen-like protein n=1 Tax=Marinicrinis sediminis TaxID=1652465 RepID=A0ABW5R7V3_9BACL